MADKYHNEALNALSELVLGKKIDPKIFPTKELMGQAHRWASEFKKGGKFTKSADNIAELASRTRKAQKS